MSKRQDWAQIEAGRVWGCMETKIKYANFACAVYKLRVNDGSPQVWSDLQSEIDYWV